MKQTKLLLLFLALAVLLCACAAPQSAQTATQSQTRSDSADAAVVALSQSAEESEAQSAEDSDEVFSDRDLSGEYDDRVVTVTLTGDSASADADGVEISGSTVTVTAAGTYILSGELKGSVIVNASKDDKVQLVLDGAVIQSESFAAIYVAQADKVFLTLAEGSENTLSNGGSFTQIDENNVDAAVFSKDDLTFNGTGKLTVSSPGGHGIVCKDELVFTDGVYEISAGRHAVSAKDSISIAGGDYTLAAYGDGLHAENDDDETLGGIYISGGAFRIGAADDGIHAVTTVQIDGGSFEITAAEGIEGTCIRINDGEISIEATDDGVNAAYKSSAYTPTFEMNGGSLTVVMGAGDTDGVDSNGNIVINGGTVDITASSSFDCDGSAQLNGGTVIVNGQQVDAIPNQMMGGGKGGMQGGMGGRHGGWS